MECQHGIDPADCHAALDYFGFGPTSDFEMVIREDDPQRVGKIMKYKAYRHTMKMVQKAVQVVEYKLTKDAEEYPAHHGSQMTFIVDAHSDYDEGNLLLKRYPEYPAVCRFKGYYISRESGNKESISNRQVHAALGGDGSVCRAARRAVAAQVSALGGVKADWSRESLVTFLGEFSELETANYYVLTVKATNDTEEESDGNYVNLGIKRLRTS